LGLALALGVLGATLVAPGSPAAAQTFTFEDPDLPAPEVIDGDTFRVGETVFTLWGVDAPEAEQMCPSDTEGLWFTAGEAAIEILDAFVRNLGSCNVMDVDQYGRTVARCYSHTAEGSDIEIGPVLVYMGLAVDVPEYSGGLFAQIQVDAEEQQVGMWAEGIYCDTPAEWRRRQAG